LISGLPHNTNLSGTSFDDDSTPLHGEIVLPMMLSCWPFCFVTSYIVENVMVTKYIEHVGY